MRPPVRRLEPDTKLYASAAPNAAVVTVGIGDGFRHGFDVRLNPFAGDSWPLALRKLASVV